MPFNDVADGGHQRADIAAVAPLAAPRVEHLFQLFRYERDLPATPEHGADHPRQRHDPGIVLEVLRVNEDLERPGDAVLLDVVDRDVHSVFAVRPAQLVGRAGQLLGPQHEIVGAPPDRRDGFGRFDLQHRSGDRIRPIRRAALAAAPVGVEVDLLETLEADVLRNVHRFGDRAVDMALHRRLHTDMFGRGEVLRRYEVIGQPGRLAMQGAEAAQCVVRHLLLDTRAVRLAHLACVGQREDRLDAAGHVIRNQ